VNEIGCSDGMNDKSVAIILTVQGILMCVLPIIGLILYSWPFLVVFPFPYSPVVAILSFYSAVKIYRDDKTDLMLHVYTVFCAYLGILNFAIPFTPRLEMFYPGLPVAPIHLFVAILLYLPYPLNLIAISGGYFLVIPPLIMEIHLKNTKEPDMSSKQAPEIV
jgi:hypothetical protein